MIYKNKLEPKFDGFVFVGNDKEMKIYKLYYPQFQKVHTNCESSSMSKCCIGMKGFTPQL